MRGIVALFVESRPSSPIAIIPDLVRVQALPAVQQPCSNPSKYPERLGNVFSAECCHLQAFCTHLKTPANFRGALAWRRSGVQVPSGPRSFSVDLQVKREERKEAPACSRALVQQPSGATGSYSQSQTTFPPNSQRVHALLACVRSCEITLLRTLAGFLFLPRSGFVCTLCHRYHPDRRGLIASEHRLPGT